MGHNHKTKGWGHISNGRAIGIDGARGGWVCAALENEQLKLEFVSSLSEISLESGDRALIDMPIGFPSSGPRMCDGDAARSLGSRRSTVFPVPCRAAVEAQSFREACERNAELQGKKLSLQLWNIVPKMIELDVFLRSLPAAHERIAEGHPEIAFATLSPSDVPLAPKRKPEGRETRIAILSRAAGQDIWKAVGDFYGAHRPQVAIDDVIDAVALAYFLTTYGGEIAFFGDGACDAYRAPMRIATGPGLSVAPR